MHSAVAKKQSMGLNNLSLPVKLITDLYAKSLVQSKIDAAAPVKKEPLQFLGKNEKNILILVNYKSAPHLPDKELSFLTTVLSACQLGLAQVAIVNWHRLEEKDSLLIQLLPKEILFLDVPPEALGFPANTPAFSLQKFNDVQFVAAPSLTQIEKTKQEKSLLWVALKQLFCL